MDRFIVIRVPHQRRASADTFVDEEEALAFYARESDSFDAWAHENSTVPTVHPEGFFGDGDREYTYVPEQHPELFWEWFGHDLHACHRWTIREARERLAWLDEPNAGQQKIHQHLEVSSLLRDWFRKVDSVSWIVSARRCVEPEELSELDRDVPFETEVRAPSEDAALDDFHSQVPIECLEHFEVEAQMKGGRLQPPTKSHHRSMREWPSGVGD